MNIIFFDVETSGLNPEKHEIIQIAAVATKDLEHVAEFEMKIKFDLKKADAMALAVNGYEAVLWEEHAVTQREALLAFNKFIGIYKDVDHETSRGHTYSTVRLGGHNVEFDVSFLTAWYKKYGIKQPYDYLALDTLQLALWTGYLWPQEEQPGNFKLTTLCDYYDIKLAGAHDALADTRATVELARVIKEDI